MKDISIIVPHYNSVELLKKLISTVPVDDTLELIIVDDKSDLSENEENDIVALLKPRAGLFLKNTTDQKSAGICRNIGMKRATGKWLLFADADDFFVEGAFEQLKKHISSEADIVYFPPMSIYLGSDEMSDRHLPYEKWVLDYYENPSHSNEVLLRYKFCTPWSRLIRRKMIEDAQIVFDGTVVSNDVMFSMKAALEADKVEATNQCIYCITKSAHTLTTKRDEKRLETRVQIFVQRYALLKSKLNENDFQSLGISGKMWLAKAFFDGYGCKMGWKILKIYRKNEVQIFSINMLKRDVKQLKQMLFRNIKDKKRGI